MVNKKDIDFLNVLLELSNNREGIVTTDEVREYSEIKNYSSDLKQKDVQYRTRKFGDGKYYEVDGKNWIKVYDTEDDKPLNKKEPLKLEIVDEEKIKKHISKNEYEGINIEDVMEEIDIVRKENEDLKTRMKAILLSVDKVVDDEEDFIGTYKEQLSELDEE